jgi:Uncharacterized protein conserved in bacteria (DUF2188)
MGEVPKQKMRQVGVVCRPDGWVAERRTGRVYAEGDSKMDVIRTTTAKAKRDRRAVTVHIHAKDGRVQEVRTYPPYRRLPEPSKR